MDVIRLFGDGFPLTIERMQFLQDTYGKAIAQLSKVAGDGNLIIDGVQVNGSTVSDGVIIMDGEVLPFSGGTFNGRVAVFETVYEVPYNIDADNDGNLDPKTSDVTRIARCADSGGVDAISFSSLQRVGNLQSLQMPVGSIIPFDGDINNIPAGWELYDMADRFVMGAGGAANLNQTGGGNTLTIQRANLPNFTMTGTTGNGGGHSHPYKDSYFIEAFAPRQNQFSTYSSDNVGSGFHGSSATDADNTTIWYRNRNTSYQNSHNHSISVNSGGSGTSIDKRPAFKALNFIRFVGF